MMSMTNSAACKKVILVFAIAALSLSLHGCIDKGPSKSEIAALKSELAELKKTNEQSCSEKCKFDSLYGRWKDMSNGFLCWNEESSQAVCTCTTSPERPDDCVAVGEHGASLAAIGDNVSADVVGIARREKLRAGRRGGQDRQSNLAAQEEPLIHDGGVVALQVVSSDNSLARSGTRGSPRETVTNFCDIPGLAEMHGQDSDQDLQGSDAARVLESKILGDVARELETNNVDKMAKEIFTFYVCARWAPDDTFWQLAEQELPAQFAEEQLKESETADTGKVISMMYKSYKFVPMLCSRNLEVFGKTDEVDKTYFRSFRKQVEELAGWIKDAGKSEVGTALAEIDRSFCGDDAMDTCDRGKIMEFFSTLFGGKSTSEMWDDFVGKIRSFGKAGSHEWDTDFASWKKLFPYHSFIAKPEGWQADSSASPRSTQRFVVCFGKRVASELHRRPNGRHILTDQNNIGCHGWYEDHEAATQLNRMVELWKPPTCQMAEMTYTMKKEIMKKFQEMNERLFDSLPSIINDELEEEQGPDGYTWEQGLPVPYDRKEFTDAGTGKVFVDKMLVRASKGFCAQTEPGKDKCQSGAVVEAGDLGEIEIVDGGLQIVWQTGDATGKRWPAQAADLQILPYGWKARKGFHGHVKDLVAGVSVISDKAKELFQAMFSSKQKNLADLMSGSVSKWAVCPIKDTADLEELDSHLGVEDAAFQDFQKEAYSKWTGFEKEIPGEKCIEPGEVLDSTVGFEAAKVCEISELHADHVEKYTKNDTTMETESFICPLRPPLPADEQLAVLSEKKGSCFLRMTGRQEQHYGWHYQGLFPARRQNDRKPNVPNTEYELIKLLKVPSGGLTSETNFGRFCSLDELREKPRFCNLPKVLNQWNKMSDVADSLAEALMGIPIGSDGDALEALAPLGVGATAITEALAAYQSKMKTWKEFTQKNTSDKFKDAAIALGEKSWDGLRGAKRLLHSSANWLKDHVKGELPGAGRMSVELDERLFGRDISGEVLHSLSFQRSIGNNGKTSNAKERFQRYVMTVPCPDFEPAFEFGLRKQWSKVALQMVHEAYRVRDHEDQGVFDKPSLHLLLRGEALRFKKVNQKTGPSITTKPKASMIWRSGPEQPAHAGNPPECKNSGVMGTSCEPSNLCRAKWGLTGVTCEPQPWWHSVTKGGWWPVSDTRLVGVVAPVLTTGNVDAQSELYGLEMSLYCGPKKAFGESGPPTMPEGTTLESCLQQGVETNARLKAKEPWKLYFPDEVVAVAIFKDIDERSCLLSSEGRQDKDSLDALCQGAGEDSRLADHLLDDKGQPHGYSGSDGVFMGIHGGAGFPKGTLQEVVLRPADVLEALGLVTASNGR